MVNTETESQPIAVMVEGYVLKNRLPSAIRPEAVAVLKEIKFRYLIRGIKNDTKIKNESSNI